MTKDSAELAVKKTAQRIVDDNERAMTMGEGSIPADERIVEPNPADYVAPEYLQRTAPHLAGAFVELLGELRELNSRFVGERTVEAQASLSLTGDHEWLEEKFLGWCQMYFKLRGSPDRLNPQNGNDPWRLYQNCCKEFSKLLEKRILQQGTINSCVLNLSQRHMLSSFALKVLGPDLESYAKTGRDRFSSATNRAKAYNFVGNYEKYIQSFTQFLHRIAQDIPAEYAPSDEPKWLPQLQAKVARVAEDLNFLRYALCGLPILNYEKQRLAPDLWARFAWDIYHGRSIAAVLTSSTPDPTTERSTRHLLAFRRDGWLCHREYSWLRVQPDYQPEERRDEYAVSWYILDTLTSPLYEAWLRLDSEVVIARGLEAEATEDEQTAALVVAIAEPDITEVETPVGKRSRLPQLRLKRIRANLTQHFDCEWSMAKGSEQKVYRPGGKQFTFGCHGTDRPVHPVQLKNCLTRLGIPLADFISARG